MHIDELCETLRRCERAVAEDVAVGPDARFVLAQVVSMLAETQARVRREGVTSVRLQVIGGEKR